MCLTIDTNAIMVIFFIQKIFWSILACIEPLDSLDQGSYREEMLVCRESRLNYLKLRKCIITINNNLYIEKPGQQFLETL